MDGMLFFAELPLWVSVIVLVVLPSIVAAFGPFVVRRLFSVESIAEGLSALLSNDSERARLRAAGLARADSFSWAETARLTLAAYRRAVVSGR